MPPQTPNTPRIRTFEQDVAESMQNKQASMLHIALAEQEKSKEVLLETKKKRTNAVLYIFAFIFLCISLGLGLYSYFFYTPAQNSSIPKDVPKTNTLITANTRIPLEIDLQNKQKAITLLSATSSIDATLGVITEIVPYVLEINEGTETKPRTITSSEFFTLIGTSVPDIFKRALTQDISFVRVVDNGIRGGIIVQTNDYDRAIVGLLDWEKTMLTDLEKLFGYVRQIQTKELVEVITQKEIVRTTSVFDPKTKKTKMVTATTTEPVSTFEERTKTVRDTISFTNDIRKNIELRIAKGSSGTEYLVYGFPKRDILIIAGSVDVFLRLVDQLPQ